MRRLGWLGWLAVVIGAAAWLLPAPTPLRAQDSTNKEAAADVNSGDLSRPGRAQDSTRSGSATNYSSFEIIAQRNIFDPTRSGRLRGYGRLRPAAQTFTFCGVAEAALDKRHYAALFDGYGNPGRQLYVGDVINGFRVAQIPPPCPSNGWQASVQLVATNHQTFTLVQGMHMRREERGPWSATDQPEPASPDLTAAGDTSATTPDVDSSSSAHTSSNESDVIKRLRLQREKEDK